MTTPDLVRSSPLAALVPAAPVLAGLALAAAGCGAVVPAPSGEVDRRAVYQTVADALPQADFGWGDPPGVVEMAASVKAEGERPPVQPLVATERGFRVRYAVYRQGTVWIPYEAVEQAAWSWKPLPNAIVAPLLVVPFQIARATLVIDGQAVSGFLARVQGDIERMEQVSREVGLGGPWSFAQTVKGKLSDDRAEHGPGRFTLHFDFVVPVPAWLPVAGPAEEVARAFAWCAANPDAPELPEDEGEPEGAEGERPGGAAQPN